MSDAGRVFTVATQIWAVNSLAVDPARAYSARKPRTRPGAALPAARTLREEHG